MLGTFAKLKAPSFGRGKASVKFSKNFTRLDPDVRMSMVSQAMKQLRAAYDEAERDQRAVIAQEDALNAAMIQARA